MPLPAQLLKKTDRLSAQAIRYLFAGGIAFVADFTVLVSLTERQIMERAVFRPRDQREGKLAGQHRPRVRVGPTRALLTCFLTSGF